MEKQEKKVYLDLNHVFGSNFSSNIKNEIGIIEEDGKMKVVYTAGKTIVKQSIDNKTMEFIKLSDNVESIECLAISPTRNHIAVCQKIRNQNFLLLNLYGLKNRDSEIKHFKLPQTQKQSSFKIIAFSPSQSKYACCMTCQPDSQLMFLDISRSRGLAVSNFNVEGTQSISICPTQSHLISTAGKNIFKLFKVEDYSFKTYEEVKKLPKARNFTAHAWFDKTKILLGTDRGELFMIGPVGNNFEVKRHLGNIFVNETISQIQDISLTAICVFSKGFILGSSRGHFSLWMKKDESEDNFEDQYTGDLIKKWQVGESKIAEVCSLAICPLEQQIAIAFNNNNIAFLNLSSILQNEDYDAHSKMIEGDVLNYLYDGFHKTQISSMDICLQRPIIATLSKKQNMIRLWNYKKPNCQLIKIFDIKTDGIEQISSELITCLTLHPLGYYIAVGCCDKLRIFHILESQLRNYRQIVLRGVCQVKFSNGGQFLAVAYPRQKSSSQKSSIHLINIYNSYTLEEIGRLSDHSNIITQLCWKYDDKSLFSVGADGIATEWKQNDPKSENKDWIGKKWGQSNSRYTSVIYQKTARSLLASGIQSNKSVIREFKIEKDQVQKLFSLGGFRVSKLQWLTSQWNIPAILAGTEDGYLKVFNSVFDNIVEQSVNVHNKQITGINTSPCGRYVITCSKDGIIFIYQVSLTNREGFANRKLHDQVNDYDINPLIGVLDDQLADVVLVQRNDINQKNRYNKLLEKNLEQMKRKLVMQQDDDNRKYQLQLKNLGLQKQKIIDELTNKFQILKNQKKDLQINAQSQYNQTQNKNQKMLEDIEALYEKKLAIENKKYFQLEEVYEKQKQKQEKEKEFIKKKIKETIQILKKQFVQVYKKAQKIHNHQQQSIFLGQKQFNEKVNQIQDEHENQLKTISEGIVELQNQKNKSSIEYITNIESLKRQCRILNDDIVRYMSENEMIDKVLEELRYQLLQVKNRMIDKKAALLQKQEILKSKEQIIGEYQERIVDLQKKKEVLSYRTWQMRQQIEPKEDQIQFLKEQIYALQKQFEKLLEDERVIKDIEAKLKKSKEKLSADLQQQKVITKQKRLKVKKICDEIDAIVQSKVSDRRYYEVQLTKLFQKYGRYLTEGKRINQNSKGLDEMERHMNHIDKQIIETNKKTDETIKKRQDEIQKATQENADLIKQVSQYRQQKLKLLQQLKNVQKIVDNLRRQTLQIKNITHAQLLHPTNLIKKSQQSQQPYQIKNIGQNSQVSMMRTNSQPSIKGKIARGINYDAGSLSIFTKAKIKDLENKLQMAKLQLRQKEVVCKIFKQKIQQHVQNQQCLDSHLEKFISDYDI